LFELFYRSPTATRQASGAGIGLFVCRQLVEAMDGRIWAAPRDPRGAAFGFALPVLDEPDALDASD
ncbi:MAG TPA: ATP-binding protein, partial [Clostridia bacterium]|nr:ATP-binding protein [Clostridia bacterium]